MTTQPERLHHLLDRLLRDVLLPEEREQLAQLVREREERLTDYENRINWHTACASCARILDSAYVETVRADTAEATVARVRQAVDAGPVGSCCAHLIHAALNSPAT
ncbi:hypothetical protein [Streptomyces sp. f150]|uniref:hypothetical protein n=1 Tax=Streptomyces sp. f150 TaxID=1827699 RepID=UPI000BF025A5|nr:hypothetical protein [Streptomyces sp. f150]